MLKKNKLNNYKRKIAAIALFFVVLAVFLIVFRSPVLAQSDANELLWGGEEGNIQNTIGIGNTDPRIMIARVIQVLLGFLGIVAVLIIMYAGWLWMNSQGDPQKLERAKQILKNGVIGLIIILMAFAIATFIISLLYGSIVSRGTTPRPRPPGGGVGALGTCTIERVYPEPGQKEVPRNTSIIVTFREDVELSTIMDGDRIIPDRVRIFKKDDGDSCKWDTEDEVWYDCERTNVVDVTAVTNDSRTFVFIPDDYLGDGLHYFDYVVYLSNEIEKTEDFGGGGIFETCRTDYFEWGFEVSDKVDLTPPQVDRGGVFPREDDARNEVSTSEAVQAEWMVTFTENPQPRVLATFTNLDPGDFSMPGLEIVPDSENTEFDLSGVITISINTGAETAAIGIEGVGGLGSGNIDGDRIVFPNLFTVQLENPDEEFEVGDFWTLDATSYIAPDTLRVGSINYIFVQGASIPPNQIQIGGNITQTIDNIFLMPGHPEVEGFDEDPSIHVVAKVAGAAGNSIVLSSNSSGITIVQTVQGQDGGTSLIPNGTPPDEPRNAVIQINFNEAMMPIALSGDASELQESIAVKCLGMIDPDTEAEVPCSALLAPEFYFNCDGDICIHGTFEISNQYRTVEFISNNQCGVNACGEPIYCLPENSHLRVDIDAAQLEDCLEAVCTARSPFTDCGAGGHCYDTANDEYLPLSDKDDLMGGAMDAALNSLDGNRDDKAVGPESFFNENDGDQTNGDSFLWSFYISDEIELDPPYIVSTDPVNEPDPDPPIDNPVSDLEQPVNIVFNKLMMSSSLTSGSRIIDNGQTRVEHQLVNIWNFAGLPLGYWITKENIDDDSPPDGYPDHTDGQIRHTRFGDNISFRAQVGSGVKDIYQNCMKPAIGPACAGAYNSCCSGTPSMDASCD